ncbi:MAG: acyltransferase [Candidatus Odinarchaeota archaeon]
MNQEPFIAPSALVEDDVVLGKGVKVWHYVQIRKGAIIGEGTQIGSFTYIDLDVKIGKDCSIQSKVYIPRGVEIGNKVFLGPACTFTNDKYPVAKPESWELVGIKVEDGVSIGANATICPGITIGKNALVGAGAVVTRDVSPGAVVVGNPARKIRDR